MTRDTVINAYANEIQLLIGDRVTDMDREQLGVMLDAFLIYKEKNAEYQDLWVEGGWQDSAHHVRHKGSRIGQLLDGVKGVVDAIRRKDDAYDLINYCCFFIRNVDRAN